jgi:hypothetical protein
METKKESVLKKVFNSKVALYFGALLIFAGGQNPTYFIAGIIVIIGAFACISANQRKNKPSTFKFIVELVLIALIVFSVIFSNRRFLVEDPVPNLIIPVWAVIAYVVKLSKKKLNQDN